ncbi:MAG TPA: cytidyltransferase, partial [Bacteroidetes bacterium]|nr:cytidyltransferase [Bacteroidota bacterium]
MKKVFVSGCYDAMHGGHVEFFRQAKALGDHLTVCVPSDDVLLMYKKRLPWIPLD